MTLAKQEGLLGGRSGLVVSHVCFEVELRKRAGSHVCSGLKRAVASHVGFVVEEACCATCLRWG